MAVGNQVTTKLVFERVVCLAGFALGRGREGGEGGMTQAEEPRLAKGEERKRNRVLAHFVEGKTNF